MNRKGGGCKNGSFLFAKEQNDETSALSVHDVHEAPLAIRDLCWRGGLAGALATPVRRTGGER